jgi:hypothetical protein
MKKNHSAVTQPKWQLSNFKQRGPQMADQLNVSSSVPEKISQIDEAAAWLSKAGYKDALYELITNIEHEVSQKHTLSDCTYDYGFKTGKRDYSNGVSFQKYKQISGELRKAWRAGWLSAAGENALLLKVNDQMILNAQEYLKTTDEANAHLKKMASTVVNTEHRHSLTKLIEQVNQMTKTLEGIVNKQPAVSSETTHQNEGLEANG